MRWHAFSDQGHPARRISDKSRLVETQVKRMRYACHARMYVESGGEAGPSEQTDVRET
jgi:hypothetical protein